MAEPQELRIARRRLAEAEAVYRTPEGLAKLLEGLELLEEVIAAAAGSHAATAANLAAAYAARMFARIKETLDGSRAVPEPELEQLFKLALAFDRVSGALPPAAAALKIEVVRRLIERYYEGHSPEAKADALAQLAQLTGDG